MASATRLIKKYANRRLYDTGTSQSITLDDVRDLVGAGERVRVVEAKTGRDVTRAILLQIVAEQELFGHPVLSNEVLSVMIRMNSNPMRDFTRDFLEHGMRQLQQQRSRLDAGWREGLRKAGLHTLAELSTVPMEPLNRLQQEMFSIWSEALATFSSRRPARPAPSTEPEVKPDPGED